VFDSSTDLKVPFDDLIDRFLFVQAIETQRVFDDGVMDSDADANIGSIFGIGYPAWTGGVRQFVKGCPGGRAAFLERADQLAARYGERFLAPETMR
jgi:3-hydroxyacyl-CoA dehydrogenase / enoyl-CoA hydratase / 3-hydroxybutyryl-CoA epimerase